MQRTTRLILLALVSGAGCKPTSNGAPTPPYVLSWAAAPAPIMVRQYDPVAPTLPCVTVHVAKSAGSQQAADSGSYPSKARR